MKTGIAVLYSFGLLDARQVSEARSQAFFVALAVWAVTVHVRHC